MNPRDERPVREESVGGEPRADWLYGEPRGDQPYRVGPNSIINGPLSDQQIEELKSALRNRNPLIVVPNEESDYTLEPAQNRSAEQAPSYVHKLLDAIIEGLPLDFAQLDVPTDVKARLERAYGREPAHQRVMSDDSRAFGREQLVRAALPVAIERRIRGEERPLGEILRRREEIMPMGDVDRSLLETALDYIEREELDAAREHLAAMTNGGLTRAISDVQVLQVLMAGTVFSLVNSGLANRGPNQ